jgi:hypothetical protein
MILDNLKRQMAEIFYLANTPTYIFRNIVDIFSNVDFQTILEHDLDLYEASIKQDELYLFYLIIYIRIRNNFVIEPAKYKNIKWYDEYITYCKLKQINTLTSSFTMGDEILNASSVCEVNINA